MKKAVVKSVAALMCISSVAYAGTVKDYKHILIDNCCVTMQPGRNIASFGVPYMYASDFTSAQLPSGAAENVYVPGAHIPGNAIDGNLSTIAVMGNRWDWALVLDLQQESLINRISLRFADGGFPTNYDILVTTEEKPSIATDGSVAMQNWVENLDLIINESENSRAGVHEFNFKPIKARYVVIRDNIPQTNVRQMSIAEIEVNEAADFYLHSNDTLTALYNIEKGNVRRVINEEKQGVLINALFGENGGIAGNISVNKVKKTGDFADIYIDRKSEYEDYSRCTAGSVYFVSAPGSKVKINPKYYAVSDSPGMRYVPELNYYGKRIYLHKAELATDESIATYASAQNSGSALCVDFGEEKQISATEIVFEESGCPAAFDIVAEMADGKLKTVVSVVENKKNNLCFEFEITAAKKVYIYEKSGSPMHVADVHIYDKMPQYQLKSFIFGDLNSIMPIGEKKILK